MLFLWNKRWVILIFRSKVIKKINKVSFLVNWLDVFGCVEKFED